MAYATSYCTSYTGKLMTESFAMQQPPRLVPAVDRAARLLDVLESAGRGLTISELARELGINKGTMRDLLETLRAHRLLERDEERKLYRLGPRLGRRGMGGPGPMGPAPSAHAVFVCLGPPVGGG